MILREVSEYIRHQQQVPLRELALKFGMDESIMDDMLGRLIAKGRIIELEQGSPCSGGCNQCQPQSVRIFAWKKPDA